MIGEEREFLLDANVFITAHRSYYAFDLCPEFWETMKEGFTARRIYSTRRVRAELERGGDALTTWVEDHLPTDFFIDDSMASVVAEYAPMMTWVSGRDFLPAAKAKFATDADGWLVATAKQAGYCLVTHEARNEGSRVRVPIPIVCDRFGVSYCNTFELLRELGCSYR